MRVVECRMGGGRNTSRTCHATHMRMLCHPPVLDRSHWLCSGYHCCDDYHLDTDCQRGTPRDICLGFRVEGLEFGVYITAIPICESGTPRDTCSLVCRVCVHIQARQVLRLSCHLGISCACMSASQPRVYEERAYQLS